MPYTAIANSSSLDLGLEGAEKCNLMAIVEDRSEETTLRAWQVMQLPVRLLPYASRRLAFVRCASTDDARLRAVCLTLETWSPAPNAPEVPDVVFTVEALRRLGATRLVQGWWRRHMAYRARHPGWDPRRPPGLAHRELSAHAQEELARFDEFGKLVSVELDENSPPYIKHATVAALEGPLRAREVRMEKEEGREKRDRMLATEDAYRKGLVQTVREQAIQRTLRTADRLRPALDLDDLQQALLEMDPIRRTANGVEDEHGSWQGPEDAVRAGGTLETTKETARGGHGAHASTAMAAMALAKKNQETRELHAWRESHAKRLHKQRQQRAAPSMAQAVQAVGRMQRQQRAKDKAHQRSHSRQLARSFGAIAREQNVADWDQIRRAAAVQTHAEVERRMAKLFEEAWRPATTLPTPEFPPPPELPETDIPAEEATCTAEAAYDGELGFAHTLWAEAPRHPLVPVEHMTSLPGVHRPWSGAPNRPAAEVIPPPRRSTTAGTQRSGSEAGGGVVCRPFTAKRRVPSQENPTPVGSKARPSTAHPKSVRIAESGNSPVAGGGGARPVTAGGTRATRQPKSGFEALLAAENAKRRPKADVAANVNVRVEATLTEELAHSVHAIPQVGAFRGIRAALKSAGQSRTKLVQSASGHKPQAATRPFSAPAKRATSITRRVPLGKPARTGRPKVSKPTGGGFEPIEDSFIHARMDKVGSACRSILEMDSYVNNPPRY